MVLGGAALRAAVYLLLAVGVVLVALGLAGAGTRVAAEALGLPPTVRTAYDLARIAGGALATAIGELIYELG